MGRVGRPHGLVGDVVVHLETDNPERFVPGAQLVDSTGGVLTVASVKTTQGSLLVRFESFEDREAAGQLRGLTLGIPLSTRRQLQPDEYWPDQLVGLEARDPGGRTLGIVEGLVEGVAQDRLLVRKTKGHVTEIPFVSELVPRVEVEQGFLVVIPTEGLI